MREKKEEVYTLMDESWQEIDRVYNKKVEDMQYADGSPVKQISKIEVMHAMNIVRSQRSIIIIIIIIIIVNYPF